MDDLLEIPSVILVEAVGDYKRMSMIRIVIQFVIPIHGMTGKHTFMLSFGVRVPLNC
jgi:hypothetical protein